MNAKRLIALVIAVLMLVCMFSACGNDDAKTEDKGAASSAASSEPKADTADEEKEDEDAAADDTADAPVEDDLYDFEWLGIGELDSTDYPLTIQGMMDGEYEVTNQLLALAKDYKLNYTFNVVSSEVYQNTINALASTNELPDAFWSRISHAVEGMDEMTIIKWIESGMFLSCSEAIKHSTGNMQKFFGEDDGAMRWSYAWNRYVDGDWYMVTQANNTAYSMNVIEADGKLRMPTQVHGPYSIMVRQNWIDDLSLQMPDSVDAFYEVSKAIHDGDANGNGMTDERVFFGLGTEYQYAGAGSWFGLPFRDFYEDPSDGHLEVACLCDGFADWASYMNKLYNDNLTQVGDGGHLWQFSNYFPENNVIAWTCMGENVRASGISVLGEGTDYEPMPIISADGYTPRVLSQEAVGASACYSAKADTDPAAFAAFVDWMYSEEVYMLAYYGVEGESWQRNDDGSITSWGGRTVTDSSKTVEDQYKNMHAVLSWRGVAPINQNGDGWPVAGGIFDSVEDAYNAGGYYYENGTDRETWMEVNNWYTDCPSQIMLQQIVELGEENINWQAYYSYMCLPTADQIEVINAYGTDLKTYIQELATKLVTGDFSIDQIDDYVQAAYDNYHFQEYLDVLSENSERFMEALRG